MIKRAGRRAALSEGFLTANFPRPGPVFIVALLLASACSGGGAASDTTRIRELVEAAEIDSGTASESELTEAASELAALLRENGDDVGALILSARIGRLQYMLRPITFNPGEDDPYQAGIEELAPLHAFLERALAIEPENPEANYWHARLYGTELPILENDILLSKLADVDEAIRFAGAAVELEPESIIYREALATYLALAQRFDEALEAIGPAASGDHPIYLILSDFDQVPIPQGATFAVNDAQGFTDSVPELAQLGYPDLRVRAYTIPMSGTDLEEFYRGTWPAFGWCEPDISPAGDGTVTIFQSGIRSQDGESEPIGMDECSTEFEAGVAIALIELRDVGPELLSELHPLGLPDNISQELFSTLLLVDYRNLDG